MVFKPGWHIGLICTVSSHVGGPGMMGPTLLVVQHY